MGKTTWGVDVIMTRIIQDVNRVFAVCPTFWTQHQLQPLRDIHNCFSQHNVSTNVDDSVFDKIFNILNISKHIPTLLFVDDAAAEAATNKGNKGAFSRLCLASPHLNLTIVACFQRATACTVSLRDNSEFLIMFRPTKIGDVKIIIEEFNPFPALPHSALMVREALHRCWEEGRYIFVYREPYTGGIQYYANLDSKIVWNIPPRVYNYL